MRKFPFSAHAGEGLAKKVALVYHQQVTSLMNTFELKRGKALGGQKASHTHKALGDHVVHVYVYKYMFSYMCIYIHTHTNASHDAMPHSAW